MQIGLLVFKVSCWLNHVRQELGPARDQINFLDFVRSASRELQRRPYESEDRRVQIDLNQYPLHVGGDFISGIVRYGARGPASDFEDHQTGLAIYQRSIGDWENIPLFFSWYCPPGCTTAYLATQTFGVRSCFRAYANALRQIFRDRFEDYSITFEKVIALDPRDFENRSVRDIRLISRNTPPGMLQNQVGDREGALKVELRILPEDRGALGRLSEIVQRFEANAGQALLLGGLEFDRVDARIRVGGKDRRIGVIGVADYSGLIDISDDVERDPETLRPQRESIRENVEAILSQYGREFGL